jgi:iron transport multicopper oxidase
VRLAVQADGTLKAVSFFSPYNAKELDEKDLDFASSGISALNDQYFGTLSLPHLAVAAGKEGYVYLLNREELGGFQQGMGGGDKVVQRIGPYGGVWAHPGVWPGEGGWIYIPTSYSGGVLRVYKYGLSGTGEPTISLQGTSTDSFGFGSSSAVITSNGTSAGSALVWILWDTDHTGTGAQLRAYDPVPVGGHPVLRWSAPIGTQSKFVLPGVGENRIYVGNREGKVMAFGAPVSAPLTGPPTEFPTTTIGSSSEKTTTLTATTSVTVNKLTSSNAQFTVGATSPPLPATLSANQTIQVPLTFKPTQVGTVAATLTAETNQGPASFSMAGTGQSSAAQLQTTPSIIAFGGVTTGSESSSSATFSNVGSAALKINAEKLPSAPFSVTGMPAVGSELQPGKSVTVTVTFHPTSEGAFQNEFGMETTGGNGIVPVSGSAGPPGALKITTEKNEYGEVAVGQTAARSFTITNTGGTNVSITKSKPPGGGQFAATTSLAEGTTIVPGETLTETVAFKPTAPGPASDVWVINGNDTTGLHEVSFSGIGAATFGKTTVGASSDHFVAERKRVNRYALPAAGSVSKLSIYLAPGGTSGQQVLKGLIYADSSGSPGALLAVSEQLTYASTNATGWYDLKFSSPVKLGVGSYWIGVMTGSTAGVTGFRFDSVSGSRDYNTNTYASGPTNPFGSVTTDAEQMSLYATYTPTPTVPVPVNETPPEIKAKPLAQRSKAPPTRRTCFSRLTWATRSRWKRRPATPAGRAHRQPPPRPRRSNHCRR